MAAAVVMPLRVIDPVHVPLVPEAPYPFPIQITGSEEAPVKTNGVVRVTVPMHVVPGASDPPLGQYFRSSAFKFEKPPTCKKPPVANGSEAT